MTRVIDTNVPLIANGAGPTNLPTRVTDKCQQILEDLIDAGTPVALDLDGEILEEYFHQLSRSGAPGIGDAFAKYVFDSQWWWPPELRPDIGPNGPHSYVVLDGDDEEIDPSDRKFVAVAKVVGLPILQASDSKWLDWSAVLERHGVTVEFIDEEALRAVHKKKFGRPTR